MTAGWRFPLPASAKPRHPSSGLLPAGASVPTLPTMPASPSAPAAPTSSLTDLKHRKVAELALLARELGIEAAGAMKKQDLIFAILQAESKKAEEKEEEMEVASEGTIEVLPDGFGFLRSADFSYLPGPDDIYVSPSQIRRFNLRTGDTLRGTVRQPKEGERYFALLRVDSINGEPPEEGQSKALFDNLTPLYPTERLRLESDPNEMTTRVVDLFAPIGKGQRCLIVSPPRAGKTVLLQNIAHAITRNHPEVDPHRAAHRRAARGGDRHGADREGRGGGLHLRRARHPPRPGGGDGHREGPPPGRAQEGRGDPPRLHHPPGPRLQLHGAALAGRSSPAASTPTRSTSRSASSAPPATSRRAARSPSSATALVDTGSRMDEVIFEEFKGTGNSEIVLDRRLMEKRIFPCMDLAKSGTRKEELLLPADWLSKIYILRQTILNGLDNVEAMKFMLDKFRQARTHDEFFQMMVGGGK